MKIFLDASAIIYIVEAIEPWYGRLQEIINKFLQNYGRTEIAVSALSLLECRVKPMREDNQTLLERYNVFFNRPRLNIQTLNFRVIEQATFLRAQYGLKTPDALQAANAICLPEKVLFITGDRRFVKIAGLQVEIIE